MPDSTASLHPALDALLEGMTAAATAAGRPAARLLAVSKTQPAEALAELAASLQSRNTGPAAFGENYVQEALAKQPAMVRKDRG